MANGTGEVLLVSRNPQNVRLVETTLQLEGYAVAIATSVEEFAGRVEADERTRLALVDLTGFDARIWPLCDRLREASTPLLMLAARKNPAIETTGRSHGAASVLEKPVGVRDLVNLIKAMLEE